MTPTKKIAYDGMTELARMIVLQAKEMEKAEEQKNRLNMVVYTLTEENCWLGLFHIWQEYKQIYIQCQADDNNNKMFIGWLKPLQLTLQNMTRLLMIRNQRMNTKAVFVLYHGIQEPDDWYDPDPLDNEPLCLHIYIQNCAFCHEFDTMPTAIELSQIVKDFFY